MSLNHPQNLILEAGHEGDKYSTLNFTISLRVKEICRYYIYRNNNGIKIDILKRNCKITFVRVDIQNRLTTPTKSHFRHRS